MDGARRYQTILALAELGIAVQLTAPTFLIVLGAIALAAAIAFGWGGRDVAKDLIERYYDRRDEVTNSGTAGSDGGESGTDRPNARPLLR